MFLDLCSHGALPAPAIHPFLAASRFAFTLVACLAGVPAFPLVSQDCLTQHSLDTCDGVPWPPVSILEGSALHSTGRDLGMQHLPLSPCFCQAPSFGYPLDIGYKIPLSYTPAPI